MPSALSQSRDFVSRALARVRSGVEAYAEDLDKPGLDIKVEPFDAHNASTAAGLVKLGTQIGATRRARANRDYVEQDLELEREKNRAQIAEIRAREKYYLGEGRETGSDPAVLSHQVGIYPPGTPVSTVNAGLSNERLQDQRKRDVARDRRTGKLSGAQEGMRQLNAQIDRDVARLTARGVQSADATFRRVLAFGDSENLDVRTTSPNGPPKTLRQDLMDLGIEPASWEAMDSYNRQKILADARAALPKRYEPGFRRQVETYYQGRRGELQRVIDEAAGGVDDEGGIEEDGVIDLIIGPDGNLVPR